MKAQHLFVCGICAVMLAFAFAACKQSVNPDPAPVTITSITAVYSSTNPIFPGPNLHTLRDGLTVTAHYSDSTTKTLGLEEYELSGDLTQGSSVITVTYQGKTATFTVTVQAAHDHVWGDWVETTPPTCSKQGEDTRICTAVTPTHDETRAGAAIDPTAHIWGNPVPTTPATFVTAGTGTRTCTLNSAHTESQTLPANPVMKLEDWNEALGEIRTLGTGNYTITIGASFGGMKPLTGTPTADTHFGTANNVIVTLKGSGTLDMANENGNMFRVRNGHTLIIDSPELTLRGRRTGVGDHTGANNNPIILVESGGTLDLRNGKISGNTSILTYNGGGGVNVNSGGTFTMSGGEISDNIASHGSNASSSGGGVQVSGGTFTMTGGTIKDNRAISNNTYGTRGGGVFIGSGTFTMSGGTIKDNNASGNGNCLGGGVYQNGGTFVINGGIISGNSASSTSISYNSYGGGVYQNGGTFRIVNGTVYGSNATTALQNTSDDGAALYKGTSATAQRGTFSGTDNAWVSNGDLTTTNNTISVVNGVSQ